MSRNPVIYVRFSDPILHFVICLLNNECNLVLQDLYYYCRMKLRNTFYLLGFLDTVMFLISKTGMKTGYNNILIDSRFFVVFFWLSPAYVLVFEGVGFEIK